MKTKENRKTDRLRRLFMGGIVTVLLLLPCALIFAQEETAPSSIIIHVTGNYHAEARDLVGYADGFDVLAGVDFLVADFWGGLYIGPRIGWYAETVCTAYMTSSLTMRQKPSLGAQIYIADSPSIWPSWFALPFGLAFDVLFNLDELHAGAGEPFYLFTSVFIGLRFLITEKLHVEARLEAGLFPFFNPPPYFIKGGVQIGWSL
jgi:hypothetical protein